MNKLILFLIVAISMGCYPTKPNPYFKDNSNVVPSMKGLYIKNPYYLGANLKKDSVYAFDFTLKNRTSNPVVLESVKASCKCTKPTYDTSPIKPGETRHIIANFHADYEGVYHHTVYIKTSLSDKYLGLILQGNVGN
jgi:Protein of unknown function (DUF1573)